MSTSGRSTPTLSAPGTSSNSGSTVRVVLRIRPPPSPETSTNIPPRFQRSVLALLPGSQNTLSVDVHPVSAYGSPIASPTSGSKNNQKQYFSFDRVFSPQDNQEDVYGVAEDLVDKFIEGFNVTVLAYGQTSSGKSYTTDHIDVEAEGPNRLGIIPRAVSEIFEKLETRIRDDGRGFSYQMKNSYIELYNEDLIDLMATGSYDRPQVSIREDKQGNIIWTGLKEAKVTSATAVMSNLELGSAVRQSSATDMNTQSSRSHAIFSLTLTQRKWTGAGPPSSLSVSQSTPSRMSKIGLPRGASPSPGSRPMSPADRPGSRFGTRPPSALGTPGRASPSPSSFRDDSSETPRKEANDQWVTVTSKFHFVDLAGSERLKRTAAVGERVKEGISINSGLHALGNVISALGDPQKARIITHIPYRDSKLTRLLQDSLGGNSWTLFVACVSPTEYNLNETINTLKYANRARNIKNQATINEVEVGWDDIDHVQNLVLKLRAELAALKAGGSATDTISEEPPSPLRGKQVSTPATLELQEKFADLSQKYAKLTAELAKTGNSHLSGNRTPGSSLSPEDFAVAVEPVIEEYEKSLSALESQLSLTKAALSFAEEEMKQQESTYQENKRQAEEEIAELNQRVAKLLQRENTSESYIRDLEARIKSSDEGDSDYQISLADLRKELAKYKETEAYVDLLDLCRVSAELYHRTTDAYIRELEKRLISSDETTIALRKQVEQAEIEIGKRDKQLKDLKNRMFALESDNQHRLLEQRLNKRNERLAQAEEQLSNLSQPSENSLSDQKELRDQINAELGRKEDLQRQIANLDAVGSRPESPMGEDSSSNNRLSLVTAHSSLKDRYEQTLAELESVNTKYHQSLQQIELLHQQLDDQKVEEIGGSPKTSLNGSSYNPRSQRHSLREDSDRPSLLNLSGSPTSTRRSMPIGVVSPTLRNNSFFGRGGLRQSSSFSHLRSVSLSQEPLSATSLHAAHPSIASSGARSPSPNPSLAESTTEPHHRERTYDSLLKEVTQLQEVLKSREDELRSLEATVREQSSRKNSTVSISTEEPNMLSSASGVAISPSSSASQLSPQSEEMLQTLKTELGLDSTPETLGNTMRVDELMRSMARKEAVHRHIVEDLTSKLENLQKQHVELEKLSKDQVDNMSREIEDLRQHLEVSQKNRQKFEEEILTLRKEKEEAEKAMTSIQSQKEAHMVSQSEHAAALAAKEKEYSESVAKLQDEHSVFLGEMIKERQAIFVQRAREHDQKMELLQSELEEKFNKASQEYSQRLSAANARIKSLESERSALQQSVNEMRAGAGEVQPDDNKDPLGSLQEQHEDLLHRREKEHAGSLEKLKQEHAAAVQAFDLNYSTGIARFQEEHDLSIRDLINSHDLQRAELGRTHREHMATVETRQSQLSAEKDASHADEVDKLRREIDLLTTSSQDQLKDLAKTHKDELKAAISATQKKITDAANEEYNALLTELSTARTTHAEEVQLKNQQISEVEVSLSQKSNSLQDLREQIRLVETKNASLCQQLESLQVELGIIGQKNEDVRQIHTTEVLQRTEESAAALESAQRAHSDTEQQLRDAQSSVEEKDKFIQQVRADLKEAQERQTVHSVEGELQDALAALETLEKALMDSQEERDELLGQIDQLRANNTNTGGSANTEKLLQDTRNMLNKAHSDLHFANKEREELKSSQAKLALTIKEMQTKLTFSGHRSPELGRASSDVSSDEAADHRASLNGFSNSPSANRSHNMSTKSPPTVPPPAMSLPPLPATFSQQFGTSSRSSTSEDRTSGSQTAHKTSTANGAGSRSSTTSISTVDVNIDPRLQKRMDEQDANIVALNKQLAHCESDLRANLQLVSTLESALNEAERNLRKSRMQLNEYAKERDSHAKTSDSLRQQLQSAFTDMETLRENLAKAKQEGDNRLAAERQQRDAARDQLEARMNEMRARKSKLNCF